MFELINFSLGLFSLEGYSMLLLPLEGSISCWGKVGNNVTALSHPQNKNRATQRQAF